MIAIAASGNSAIVGDGLGGSVELGVRLGLGEGVGVWAGEFMSTWLTKG